MIFSFVHAEKANFKVSHLCDVLGVTRQGYYASRKRNSGPRQLRRDSLEMQVHQVFARSRQTYGSPRIHRELLRSGKRVARRSVERAMRELGLVARHRKGFRLTTRSDPTHAKASNLLAREFYASRPDEKWVTDITYIRWFRGGRISQQSSTSIRAQLSGGP